MLTVVDHPLARARLSRMRDERTDNAAFRAALRELTQMLVYEATRDLAVAEEPITTPVTETTGYRLAAPPLIVPTVGWFFCTVAPPAPPAPPMNPPRASGPCATA